MSHEIFWLMQLIQLIWIFYEIHEVPWLWIWKHMNFYEYESVHSCISMTMNFKSHEFQWFWKKYMSCMTMNSKSSWLIRRAHITCMNLESLYLRSVWALGREGIFGGVRFFTGISLFNRHFLDFFTDRKSFMGTKHWVSGIVKPVIW